MSGASQKLYKLSAPLSGLLGKSELTRPAAVKELYVNSLSDDWTTASLGLRCVDWVYVKQHELQDKKNGRVIHPNAEMKAVFGVDKIGFTQVMGLLKNHMEKPKE